MWGAGLMGDWAGPVLIIACIWGLWLACASVRLYAWRERDMRGVVVVVTGAASGVGLRVALDLAGRGARVAMVDNDSKGLANGGRKAGPQSRCYLCDVSDASAVARMARRVASELGRPSIIVNCAGVVGGQSIVDATPSSFLRTFRVNTLGPILITRAFLKLPGALSAAAGTRIVNVASAAGRSYAVRLADYCGSKAALIQAHHSLRLEIRRSGARVGTSILMPWHIGDTPMFSGVRHSWLVRALIPPLKGDAVAAEVVKFAALPATAGHHSVVMPARLGWLLLLLDAMPLWLQDVCTEFAGGRDGMDTWDGAAAKRPRSNKPRR